MDTDFFANKSEKQRKQQRERIFTAITAMTEEFNSLEHMGPYVQQPAIAAFCEFVERVWEIYRSLATQYGPLKEGSREYLITRMLHIAEMTSNGIRLTATWGLTPSAMSLLRDRYEQTVRFSWLVRNPDQTAYEKYERSMLETIRAMVGRLDPKTREHEEHRRGQRLPDWAIAPSTKEERGKMREWSSMKLEDMAKQRDAFPPLIDTPLGENPLAYWYGSIYTQFSAVSHYNRFAIELVRSESNLDGTYHFSFSPHWPALLVLQSGLLDVIQCFEATTVGFGQTNPIKFESLYNEWHALAHQFQPNTD